MKSKNHEERDKKLAVYKLVKTRDGNIIIRRESGSKRFAVLIGATGKLLRHEEIDNIFVAIRFAEKLRAVRYVPGTFEVALEAAKEILAGDVNEVGNA